MTLPTIYGLAVARLQANEERYRVIRVDGQWLPVVIYQSPDEYAAYQDDGELHDATDEEWRSITNAAMVRDNTLDALEELADALNIAGLLRARLDADRLTTTQHLNRLARFRACLHTAAVCLEELRAELPDHYRWDGYPVPRDEVQP